MKKTLLLKKQIRFRRYKNYFAMYCKMIYLYFVFAAISLLRCIAMRDSMNTSVWLSAAAYCGIDKYNTMNLTGPATGFQVMHTFRDLPTDLEGFLGVMDREQSIYAVFRGSASKRNWIADFEVKQVEYPCEGCKVHHGFYESVINVRDQVFEALVELRETFPKYSIVFTGHSYGAATTMLMALECSSVFPISVINFGQPRVGNPAFSQFYNSMIADYTRITHDRDIVPHVPPITEFDYLHSCGEVFEDNWGKLHICSQIPPCEDPQCADQYKLWQTNGADHDVYLGHTMSCSASIV